MTRLCGQSIPCAKPRAHEGDCATYEELAALAVVSATQAFLSTDTRPVADMNYDAYVAWRAMVDAVEEWRVTAKATEKDR